VATEEEIFQTTTDLSSLMDVKRKQNIRKGLTNVTDSCFQFFLDLDDRVRRLENHGKSQYLLEESVHVHS
jgi:hypothetical protein